MREVAGRADVEDRPGFQGRARGSYMKGTKRIATHGAAPGITLPVVTLQGTRRER